ncbi:hypothetical protein D9757_005806 [Collybiopsis confluens]|uniref:DUF6598 domain-containing protein n=1 Tax=Collybiopsis confluens TaxID=2823264 RepID=A0A8H5MAF8_9AGAR|nr:hypothetical protein D9757_005806 [Collybiopsis confluens]
MASNVSYARGQPLLEVFHVRVNKIDGQDPGFYGTIDIADSAGTEVLWKRDKSNAIDIQPGEDFLLEGPSRAMYAADEFSINVELSNSPNDVFAKHTISFNPFDYYTEYDVVHNHEVSGDHGSVSVNYMAIGDAFIGQIKVIVTGDNENPASVHGNITASNGHGQSELFRRANNQSANVEPQHPIPLLRTAVAVPSSSALVVDASLWESSDNEIARGSVEFQPEYKKSESKYITGARGKIEVQVSWR